MGEELVEKGDGPGELIETWGPRGVEQGADWGTFSRAREPQASTFLDGLADSMSPTAAARRARVAVSEVYRWKDSDPEFGAAWLRAYDAGTHLLEDAANRRAFLGTEEPVWYQGKQVGTVRKPSDRLMELMLKARAPEKYRERVDHTVTATPMTAAELAAAREAGMRPEVEAAARTIAALPVVEGTARET